MLELLGNGTRDTPNAAPRQLGQVGMITPHRVLAVTASTIKSHIRSIISKPVLTTWTVAGTLPFRHKLVA